MEPVQVERVALLQLVAFAEANDPVGPHLTNCLLGVGPDESLSRQPESAGHSREGNLVHASVPGATVRPDHVFAGRVGGAHRQTVPSVALASGG